MEDLARTKLVCKAAGITHTQWTTFKCQCVMQHVKLSKHSDFDNYIPYIHDLFTYIIIEHVLTFLLINKTCGRS